MLSFVPLCHLYVWDIRGHKVSCDNVYRGELAMRWIGSGLMMVMASCGLMANGEEASPKAEQQTTVHDLDRQILFLKDNIEKYNAMAKSFDRKVGDLQSKDYNGSRDFAVLRDECRGIAKDLESHLVTLEQKRAQMQEQQNAKK